MADYFECFELSHLFSISAIGIALVIFAVATHLSYYLAEDNLDQGTSYKCGSTLNFIRLIRICGLLFFLSFFCAVIAGFLSNGQYYFFVFRISLYSYVVATLFICFGYGRYVFEVWLREIIDEQRHIKTITAIKISKK